MNEYEITYLTDPQLNEDARGELDAAVDAKLNELAGNVIHASASLRRRLAYPINKTNSAFLRHLQIKLDPAKIAELNLFIKKYKGVIRLTTLATPQRHDVSADIIERSRKAPVAKGKPKKAAKEVTMADVEKGIEEALTEEVK